MGGRRIRLAIPVDHMRQAQVLEPYETWVIATIRAASFRQPAYFLAIAYDGDDDEDVYIALGVGLDRERKEADPAKKEDWTKYGDWYNPANFENYELGYATLPKSVDLAPDEKAWGRDFYVELSRRLALRDWSKDLPITDDFVVFATDYHLDHLGENFGLSVPAPLRERLLADGWIPEALARGVPMW